MPPQLMEKKRRERRFLEQLFDTSSLEPYHVPVTINASLRSYQQVGMGGGLFDSNGSGSLLGVL